MRRVLTLLMVLLIAVASASAFARGGGGHGHSGGGGKGHSGGHHSGGSHSHHSGGSFVGFGAIVAGPAFWYYPPPYYPPDAVTPYVPPVYIEQDNALSAPDLPVGYWYYCAEAQAYYPYVKECAGTWQAVAPQSPAGQ
jgi:hypothetical protein